MPAIADGLAPVAAPHKRPSCVDPLPAIATAMDKESVLEKRRAHLGPNLALFFREDPLLIVQGSGCELVDQAGTRYLDCINNVSHVGHSHPAVAAAVARQLFRLNTNSRYLHPTLGLWAERLAGTMPAPLTTVLPVCSGSEANDLAWRIACSATPAADNLQVSPQERPASGQELHVAVMDHSYHGHTTATLALSAYKFFGPGGAGRPAHVHVLPCPDPYRGKHLDGTAAARVAVGAARAAGGRIAAFFCESVISCGGQVVLPKGYLRGVYEEMRAAGAVVVADEVQCGFGRVGSSFWGFQLQEVVPDIVTCGKPMGNGFPMAAVVTTRQLADTFARGGMEFFATFGGCTAAAAAGLAVLNVIRDEALQQNAVAVGAYAVQQLRLVQDGAPDVIGDVRGVGLMLGIELVTDCDSKTPAPALARHIKERCKTVHKVLLSTEGPFGNIIKVKPPICFSRGDVDRMVAAIADCMVALDPERRAALLEASLAEVASTRERRAALGALDDACMPPVTFGCDP